VRPRYSARLSRITVKVEFLRGCRLNGARGSSACFGSWQLNDVDDGAPDQGTTEMIMNNGLEAGCAPWRGIRLIFVDNGSSEPATTSCGLNSGCFRAGASVPKRDALWVERSGSERGALNRARASGPRRQARRTADWLP
jgi:hypothetical protein